METSPFNKKIHALLVSKGYEWIATTGSDKYILDKIIIRVYPSGYVMILDKNEVKNESRQEFIRSEIMKVL